MPGQLDDQMKITGEMLKQAFGSDPQPSLVLTHTEIAWLALNHAIIFELTKGNSWPRKPRRKAWRLAWMPVSDSSQLRFRDLDEYLANSADPICQKAWLWYCKLALDNDVEFENFERVGDFDD